MSIQACAMFNSAGPLPWDPEDVEQFQHTKPDSKKPERTKEKLPNGFKYSSIATDGSKVAVANDTVVFVYAITLGKETEVIIKLLGRSSLFTVDNIRAIDICSEFAAVVTNKKVALLIFPAGASSTDHPEDVEIRAIKFIEFQGSEEPRCVTIGYNQVESWAWVVVGGAQDVYPYFFRKRHSTWSHDTATQEPTLQGGVTDIEFNVVSVSPNESDNPYATIIVAGCATGVIIWDLRPWGKLVEESRENGRPVDTNIGPTSDIYVPADRITGSRTITSLTVFLTGSGVPYVLCTMIAARETLIDPEHRYVPDDSFISPIATTDASQELLREAENPLYDINLEGDDAIAGHISTGCPYFVVVRNKMVKLMQLEGEQGGLSGQRVDIHLNLKLRLRESNFQGISIRLVYETNYLRIVTADYARIKVTTIHVPGLSGPPSPPAQIPEADSRSMRHLVDSRGVHELPQPTGSSVTTSQTTSNSSATTDDVILPARNRQLHND